MSDNEKKKFCPITPEAMKCGDWCALFNIDYPVNLAQVNLCHNKHYQCNYADFTDEREKS